MNEEFEIKMNKGVSGNSKLFWKEVSKVNGGSWRVLWNMIEMRSTKDLEGLFSGSK